MARPKPSLRATAAGQGLARLCYLGFSCRLGLHGQDLLHFEQQVLSLLPVLNMPRSVQLIIYGVVVLLAVLVSTSKFGSSKS